MPRDHPVVSNDASAKIDVSDPSRRGGLMALSTVANHRVTRPPCDRLGDQPYRLPWSRIRVWRGERFHTPRVSNFDGPEFLGRKEALTSPRKWPCASLGGLSLRLTRCRSLWMGNGAS